jgi:hypothetical protein
MALAHRGLMAAVGACCFAAQAQAQAPARHPEPQGPPPSMPSMPPSKSVSLTPEQLTAVGILVGHASAAKGSQRATALGEVIDPETVIADFGAAEEAEAADQTNLRELERLTALLAEGDASTKLLEAARADRVKSAVRARSAAARVASYWGPVARLTKNDRERLLTDVGSGAVRLVRADLSGRQSIATPPRAALLDVDGVQVPASILGVLAQRHQPHGAALLLAVRSAPPGLGAGARLAVTLLNAPISGRLLPRDAIFYDEGGAFVFQQTASRNRASTAAGKPALPAAGPAPPAIFFRTARITLLGELEDEWLVAGIDDDDEIVLRGGGSLWSLLEIHGQVADGDDDDDD